MKITITEALAEIKTIVARIQKKRETIKAFLGRDSRLRDPMEKDGGSHAFVARERQSVADLEERIVTLRSAIQRVNLATELEVEGVRRTVAEWLNWRRDVAPGRRAALVSMTNQISSLRQQAVRAGQPIRNDTDGTPSSPQGDLIVSVNEAELAKEVDATENIIGQLDGKLSLVNATTTIEV